MNFKVNNLASVQFIRLMRIKEAFFWLRDFYPQPHKQVKPLKSCVRKSDAVKLMAVLGWVLPPPFVILHSYYYNLNAD